MDRLATRSSQRVLAWQLADVKQREHRDRRQMAERMGTSAAQVDRLLDPEDGTVHHDTVHRAAAAAGRRIRFAPA